MDTNNNACVIALAGKGGVGKTSLSAAIVRVLCESFPEKKILAIDADPAIGLAIALGVSPRETLDDIRKRVVDDVTGNLKSTEDVLAEAKFSLFDAMSETDKFAFLAVGRPEAEGCYCAVNAYLRNVISMLVHEFDYVVIDGEAGIEQINRRVMDKVSKLVLVSDQSKKGINIIGTIKKVADEMMMCESIGAVINRAPAPDKIDFDNVEGAPLVAVIPMDMSLVDMDIEGENVFTLPKESELLKGAKKILTELHVLD
ncbi:ATP-binding protein [Guggenheimella bovis]